jgi:hypothetical protein
MIGLLQPAALWGLFLIAIPIAIHLLRPRHAPRVRFPTIRFVPAAPSAAVRIGPPSDLLLLALRAAVVACAVLAAAQPLLFSASRLAGWNGRIARAVVVDASESMRAVEVSDASGGATRSAVDAERASASLSNEIHDAKIADGLRRAVAWLDCVPPARREIVVVSDFQIGTLAVGDLDAVPKDVGLRFVRIDNRAVSRSFDVVTTIGAPGIASGTRRAEVLAQGTRTTSIPANSSQPGLRLISSAPEREEGLVKAVAVAGTPAPDAAHPITVRLAAAGDEAVTSVHERWMLTTVVAMRHDRELIEAGGVSDLPAVEMTGSWMPVVSTMTGGPVLRAAASGRELVLDTAAPPETYFAAAVVRAALAARARSAPNPDIEVAHIAPSTLQNRSRPSGPVPGEAWRRSTQSDARWCWVAAAALLLIEAWLRRRSRAREEEQRAAA